MRVLNLSCLALALAAILAGCADPSADRRRQMQARAEAATAAGLRTDPAVLPAELLAHVVRIEYGDRPGRSFCTGVLVAPDLVATASHCLLDKPVSAFRFVLVDGAARPGRALVGRGLELYGGTTISFNLLWADWAVIRTDPFDRPGLPIRVMRPTEITNAARDGATVLGAGYHKEKLQGIGPCRLRPLWEFGFFETACPVAPGDSGGPVVLMTPDGPRLIGLFSAGRDGVVFAVSTLQFEHLLPH